MPQTTQTFRVFVSSTFSDLKAERNALQARVFPRLRALAAEHGCRFQAIDLRWGVSDQASLDQQAMQICLDEIARCQTISPRPNFMVLLGDRYGWCPPPARIPDDLFQKLLKKVPDEADTNLLKEWYVLDQNAVPAEQRLKPRQRGGDYESYAAWEPVETRLHDVLADAARALGLEGDDLLPFTTSATEQEIAHGALRVEDADQHVFCFFRNVESYPESFDPAVYFAHATERLVEQYPDGLPDADCEAIWADIQALGSDSAAAGMDAFITARLADTARGTPAEDLLQDLRGWLHDVTAHDFLNLEKESWTAEEAALAHQTELKSRLEKHVPANVHTYPAAWTGAGVSTDHIDALCEDVYQSLAAVIQQQMKHPPEAVAEAAEELVAASPALDDEGRAHRRFAIDRLQHFIGRTQILKTIAAYLSGGAGHALVVHGTGGTGKSALSAKAIQEAQGAHAEAAVVYRFIGATPGSAEGRSLLESLCREISRAYGKSDSDVPMDLQTLIPELATRMALATAEKPLILFLDSLDQLASARSLAWLPAALPEHVRVVTTTRPEDTLDRMKDKGAQLEELGGLDRGDGEKLLKAWLGDVHRQLQSDQTNAVLDAFDASGGAPLYLKLASEEARLWPSGDGLAPETLAEGITGVIEHNLMERLEQENNHGEVLVAAALGYLVASRYGLAEDEMVDLLSRDLAVYRWFLEGSYHLPADLVSAAASYRVEQGLAKESDSADARREAMQWLKEIRTPPENLTGFLEAVLPKADGPRLPIVLWSRLSLDLAPYLAERESEGAALMTFYHRELGDVAAKLLLEDGKGLPVHEKLAAYFRAKADPEGDGSWNGKAPRGLSELPYHLTEAELWDDIFETLTDFQFLEHKAAEVGVVESAGADDEVQTSYTGAYQLQEDYERALEAMPGEGGGESKNHPLIITATKRGDALSIFCPGCRQTYAIEERLLGEFITCPGPDCKTRLKLNRFVVQMD